MQSPSLRARRATRTLSFFFPRIPFSIPQTSLCFVSSSSFLSSFSSFSFFYSFPFDGVTQKLFVCWENSILFSRGYFTITSRVRHAHIDVVVITSSSFVIASFSLALNSMYAIILIVLNDQLNRNTSVNNTFFCHILFSLYSFIMFITSYILWMDTWEKIDEINRNSFFLVHWQVKGYFFFFPSVCYFIMNEKACQHDNCAMRTGNKIKMICFSCHSMPFFHHDR
jgi:hypothetical protein